MILIFKLFKKVMSTSQKDDFLNSEDKGLINSAKAKEQKVNKDIDKTKWLKYIHLNQIVQEE